MVKQVEKVETAVEPMFQEHFVEAMAIPHKTRPIPIFPPLSACQPPRSCCRLVTTRGASAGAAGGATAPYRGMNGETDEEGHAEDGARE